MPRTSSKPLNVAVNKYLKKIPKSQARLAREIGLVPTELNRRLGDPDGLDGGTARAILKVLTDAYVITSNEEIFALLKIMQVKLPPDDKLLHQFDGVEVLSNGHHEPSPSERVSEEVPSSDNPERQVDRFQERPTPPSEHLNGGVPARKSINKKQLVQVILLTLLALALVVVVIYALKTLINVWP